MPIRDKKEFFLRVIRLLKEATRELPDPAADLIVKEFGRDPFLILISCLLSLRTKDTTSVPISRVLFASARTPYELAAIPLHELEAILFSIGFYRQKAHTLRHVSQELIDRFGGKVPSSGQKLRTIKGIGQKTANLVLGYGFDIPAICVDTHVHRLANRLGLVETKTAEETEAALQRIVPKNEWIQLNRTLVTWGQQVCVPIAPFCSKCILAHDCPQKGVKKHR
jgi:endonuclease III